MAFLTLKGWFETKNQKRKKHLSHSIQRLEAGSRQDLQMWHYQYSDNRLWNRTMKELDGSSGDDIYRGTKECDEARTAGEWKSCYLKFLKGQLAHEKEY